MITIPHRDDFLAKYRFLLKPEECYMMCGFNAAYADLCNGITTTYWALHKQGFGTDNVNDIVRRRPDRVEIIHLIGNRKRYLFRSPGFDESGYPNPDPGLYHMVARWRGLYIDWSIRQFMPAAAVPFVCGEHEMRQLWRQLDTRELM